MSGSPGTVLVVEDNEDNRIIVRTVLQHVGYRVLEAVTGDEAIEVARDRHPDIILMDISLPVRDGWEATEVLKGDPATRDIPIVALTAHALPSDQERARAAGCDAYVPKPVAPMAIAKLVGWFLQPDAAGSPPPADGGAVVFREPQRGAPAREA